MLRIPRLLVPLLTLALAGPGAAPAAAVSAAAAPAGAGPAALPMGVSAVSGVHVPSAADLAVARSTDAEYEAAYFYALACLANMGGNHKFESMLLQRALQADPASALLMRERAEALVALGEPAAAAELLRKALAISPADIELRRRLSRIYQESDRLSQARALFLKPDGSDPDDPEWLRSLIGLDFVQEDLASAERRLRALLDQGGGVDDRELLALTLERRQRWAEAAAEYRRVVEADKTRTASWGRLASCEDAQGDTDAAKADLRAGLAATPDSPLLADQMGRLLYRLEDYQGAEAAFGRLVDMDATDTHSLLFRGLSRLKIGRYHDAELDFTRLGELQKDDSDQAYALALALMMQKKYPEAEEQLRRVIKINPQSEAAWAQLALIAEHQKDTAKAVDLLKQGLKAAPSSEDLALLLSSAQEDLNDLSGAEASLRDCLRKGGGDEVRFQLAVILDKSGRFPDAEQELNTLIAESPKHAQALNYLGYSWVDRGVKLPQAEDLIRRALALDPGNRYYLDSLGWALHKQGRDKEALDPLVKAAAGVGADADEDQAVVFEHLAAVQKALGQPAAAEESLAKAVAIHKHAAAKPAVDSAAKDPGL
jgi:tetratricopeptide (TPR) repeat protein